MKYSHLSDTKITLTQLRQMERNYSPFTEMHNLNKWAILTKKIISVSVCSCIQFSHTENDLKYFPLLMDPCKTLRNATHNCKSWTKSIEFHATVTVSLLFKFIQHSIPKSCQPLSQQTSKSLYKKGENELLIFALTLFSTFYFLPTALSFGSLIEGQSRFPCQSLLPDSQPGSQQNELSRFKYSPTKNLRHFSPSDILLPSLLWGLLTIRQTAWEFSFIKSNLCACQE